MARKLAGLSALAALGLVIGAAGQARASLMLTMTQVGSDVVVSGSGSANLAGLTFVITGQAASAMGPNAPGLTTGPISQPLTDVYTALSGPSSFGSGGQSFATSGTGDLFGFSQGDLLVPHGYVSGALLSGSSTFANQTFASLGVTPGTYVWTWGSTDNHDSLTLEIVTAVPEPATLSGAGIVVFLSLACAWRRLHAKAASFC
jgi:hypothetical protein